MISFNEWFNILTEAQFDKGQDSLIGKNLIRTLGGDPESTIDLTELLTVGDELLPAEDYKLAISKALDMAAEQGAQKKAIERNKLALMKLGDNQMALMSFATNLVNAALTDAEKQDRERSRAPWEKTRRPHRSSAFKRPDQVEEPVGK